MGRGAVRRFPPNPPSNSKMWSHLRFPGQFFDPQTGLHYNY
jgi:hypothetical protein